MLFEVQRWQADSWKRVRFTEDIWGIGDYYILNTIRFDSIREIADKTCSLYYFDNPYDHRDSGSYMVINEDLEDLIEYIDLPLTHNSLTLNVYEDNQPDGDTEEIEISVANFAYATFYLGDPMRSWVTYSEAGWGLKTVLVDEFLLTILAAVTT